MDILKIFDTNDLDKRILLTQGFQNSEFYNNNISLDSLFKDIIQLFIDNDKCVMFNKDSKYKINPQNGLIKSINKTNNKKTSEKNITYGSDLKIVLNNLVGLLGYEFSTSILLLSLYPTIIQQLIEEIKTTSSYKQLQSVINTIDNAYKLCGIYNQQVNNTDDNIFYYNQEENNGCINEILAKIRLRISNNNNISFEDDKQEIYDKLINMFNNTSFDSVCVRSIDNLCIEFGKYKPCYDNYFMKMWELLFKETYADVYEYENIYPKFTTNINNDLETIEIPFITLLNKYAQYNVNNYNIINNINKQIVYLKQYFKNITKKTLMSIDDNNKHLNVCVQDVLYEHLSIVFINMLIVYAKNIVILHDYTNNIGKTVKLQFMELFNSFKLTTPTLLTYSESQLTCLHYIMLTKQTLDSVYEEKQEKEKPKKTTRSRTKALSVEVVDTVIMQPRNKLAKQQTT